MFRLHTLLFSVLLVSSAAAVSAQEGQGLKWIGPEGEPLPFTSHEEVKAFLDDARVIAKRELSTGTNRPWKMKLEKDGVVANAIFRTVDVQRDRVKIEGKTYRAFRDSALFECAAYELSRLLKIENVPPCVRRKFEGEDGTLQLWIEEAMTELDRRGIQKPSSIHLARDRQTMRLFDVLIQNIDRNQGNLLIDSKDRIWFIDHTRTFGVSSDAGDLSKIVWCDREVWQALQVLEKKVLNKSLGPYIDGRRILSLMKRRGKLIQHIEERIATHGEGAVLFDEATLLDDLSDLEVATSQGDLPKETSLPVLDG